MSLLLVNGRIDGVPADLRVVGDRIVEIGPSLPRRAEEDLLDAGGRPVLPGLHDHHLHLRALAAARGSVAAGPPDVTRAEALVGALRGAAADRGWVRAVGYHESVAGDVDRWFLDAVLPQVPVRMQHRSGSLWVVNSAAVHRLGLDTVDLPGIERDPTGQPTGRLFRMDGWLGEQLGPAPLDLGAVSRHLAAFGVTGLTDATPGATAAGIDQLVAEVDAGRIVQRLLLMCPPEVPSWDHPLVSRGPYKVLLDDRSLPPLHELTDTVRDRHRSGTPVAVHCVTLVQLVVALQALASAGPLPGDRIEHASVVPTTLLGDIHRLGVTVVTNPSFVAERGDAYLAEVDPADQPDLYRCASLLRAGIPVAAGTDAPFASPDPARAIGAATSRRTATGRPLGADEAVDLRSAVGLFTGRPDEPATPRRLVPGQPADLCVVEPAPRSGAGAGRPGAPGTPGLPGAPGAPWGAVTATVVAGVVVHRPS